MYHKIRMYHSFICDEHDPRAEQPSKIKLQLKPHQLTAIKKMQVMERSKRLNYVLDDNNGQVSVDRLSIGVFADKPGFGKTMTMLGLIASNDDIKQLDSELLLSESQNCLNQSHEIRKHHARVTDDAFVKSTLIAVPHGPVFNQWYEAIKKHTTLTVYTVAKSSAIDSLPESAYEAEKILSTYDIVLVSSTYYDKLNLHCSYDLDDWKRAVIDEADNISMNGRCVYDIRTQFVWFISTRPNLLHQSDCTGYVRHSFSKIKPFLLKYLTVQNKEAYVEASFEVPPPITKRYLCKDSSNVNALSMVANHEIIDMLNSDDIVGAFRAIRSRGNDDIMNLIANELHVEIVNKSRRLQSMRTHGSDDVRFKRDRLTQEIAGLYAKLRHTRERFEDMTNKECVICYEALRQPVALPCAHLFCGCCIMRWIKEQITPYRMRSSCPICKTPIDIRQMIRLDSSEDVDCPNRPKDEMIIDLIQEKPLGKFLIFSTHDATFQRLKSLLANAGIAFQRLKGQPACQDKILSDFQNSNLRVILLNSRHSGFGIDMHFATDIVLYQKLSEDATRQVCARADRVGRTGPLTLHQLLYKNELHKKDVEAGCIIARKAEVLQPPQISTRSDAIIS